MDSKKTPKNSKTFICEKCDFKCFKNSDWDRHQTTCKHKMDDKKTPKNAEIIICEICDFKCFKNSEWDRHQTTGKHKKRQKTSKNVENNNQSTHICVCGRDYKYRQGLYNHRQKCPNYLTIINGDNSKNEISSEIIIELIKENKELKELLVGQNKTFQEQNNTIIELSKEQNKTIIELASKSNIVNNNNNSNVNSHNNNKVFNLQFFLNDTCKDAMNLTDFVNSIKQQLNDLEHIEQFGFVNGLSKLIVKNLKLLKQENRPVHCTDEKRKVIYVKDQDKWEKEDDDHKKVRRAIKKVAKDSFMMMQEFKKKYPDCMDPESKYNTRYHKLMLQVLGGGHEDVDNENKIITNISREITIKK